LIYFLTNNYIRLMFFNLGIILHFLPLHYLIFLFLGVIPWSLPW